MSEAGIEVPELRCPTTPATLASTTFCATVVPTFGSAWSSSATSVNLASLPSILILASLASSMARRAPFSLSLPRWAMPPVSGPTCAILISIEGGGGAVTTFCGSTLTSVFWLSLQPIRAIAAARAETPNNARFMCTPEWGLSVGDSVGMRQGADDTSPPVKHKNPGGVRRLLDRQHPLHQGLDVGLRHGGIGGHGGLAPDADAALLDLVLEHRRGILAAGVLLRHLHVGRPHGLGALDVVAGDAGVLLRQLFARLRGRGGGKAEDDGCDKCLLHGFSLFEPAAMLPETVLNARSSARFTIAAVQPADV